MATWILIAIMNLYCSCCFCLVAKSCPTLVTPRTVARQALLSMEFPRQEYWSGLPFFFSIRNLYKLSNLITAPWISIVNLIYRWNNWSHKSSETFPRTHSCKESRSRSLALWLKYSWSNLLHSHKNKNRIA